MRYLTSWRHHTQIYAYKFLYYLLLNRTFMTNDSSNGMSNLKRLLICLILNVLCITQIRIYVLCANSVRNYIVVTDVKNCPYVVLILNPVQCMGALIQPYWILTTAHCILESSSKVAEYKLLMGTARPYEESGQIRISRKVFVHPKYANKTYGSDIAMLAICTPFDMHQKVDYIYVLEDAALFRSVRSMISLNFINTEKTGQHEMKGYSGKLELIELNLKVMHFNDIGTKRQLLSANMSYSLPCESLIGSLLIYKKRLVGILTSVFGKSCHDSGVVYYEEMSNYNSWIKKQMYTCKSTTRFVFLSHWLFIFTVIECEHKLFFKFI